MKFSGKKILFIVAAVFTLVMIGFTMDFMSKTTRRGQKPQLQQRIQEKLKADTTRLDSTNR
jgi:Tfp pilus assembly protein PilO